MVDVMQIDLGNIRNRRNETQTYQQYIFKPFWKGSCEAQTSSAGDEVGISSNRSLT